MLLGTRMTNNEPSAITDLDVVARYDATDPNYVIKDGSNRIFSLLDKSKRNQKIEIITNESDREFTADTGFWVKGLGIISNGEYTYSCTGSEEFAFRMLRTKPSFLSINKIYEITIDATILSANLTLRTELANMYTYATNYIITNGINKIYIYQSSGNLGMGFLFYGTNPSGIIRSISVKEVLGNHITQTDITKMPIHTYDNATKEWFAQFDGVNDYLKSLPFTLNQPTSIYSCLKQNSWTTEDIIYCGNTDSRLILYQNGKSPLIRMYSSGINLNHNNNLATGQFGNIYTLFDTTNSKHKINNTPYITGNIGTSNSDGFTLGAKSNETFASNISVKEIIIKRIATDESDTIFNYFKNKHNVQY